jgi:chromosomal replication initiator protein
LHLRQILKEELGKSMKTQMESPRAHGEVIELITSALKTHIGTQKFNAWFRHGTSMEISDAGLTVSVPNAFVANWIETHYHADLTDLLTQHTGDAMPVLVAIDPALAGELGKTDRDSQADLVTRTTEGRVRTPKKKSAKARLKYKLDDFVVGESNRLAHSAAQAASHGKAAFNPLFIHGPCGVGKTHLLQGLCNAIAAHRGGKIVRWRYVTGEQFTNEYIQAVRSNTFGDFRHRYRQLDLLAIDDVHFLAAKKATQEEFLHTFNAIESAGKMIVLTSDTHPQLVSKFTPQLMSRFVAGMVVKLDAPDHETRLRILRAKAKTLKLDVPAPVAEYIASHVRTSVRELEGALVKLAAVASLENAPLTMDLARCVLADVLAATDGALTLADIESIVAAYFGVTPADLHSSRRTRNVSLARAMAMYLARHHTTMSYPEIGRAMGKNHSSVILATQRITKAVSSHADLTWDTPVGKKLLPASDLLELLAGQIT